MARELEAFRALAVEVLAECDPSFDLPKDERWLAAVRGVRRRYCLPFVRGSRIPWPSSAHTTKPSTPVADDRPAMGRPDRPRAARRQTVTGRWTTGRQWRRLCGCWPRPRRPSSFKPFATGSPPTSHCSPACSAIRSVTPFGMSPHSPRTETGAGSRTPGLGTRTLGRDGLPAGASRRTRPRRATGRPTSSEPGERVLPWRPHTPATVDQTFGCTQRVRVPPRGGSRGRFV